ncbi:hypothetical protein FS842_005515 [Serendipita sp. 407]|nr:hypothetical protein FS842_005515 [Serendipita sp. 407]
MAALKAPILRYKPGNILSKSSQRMQHHAARSTARTISTERSSRDTKTMVQPPLASDVAAGTVAKLSSIQTSFLPHSSRGESSRKPTRRDSNKLDGVVIRESSSVPEIGNNAEEPNEPTAGLEPDLPVYDYSLLKPEVSRVYIRSAADACSALEDVAGPVGFDMEWRVPWRGMPQRPVAVIQISSRRSVFIIQTSAMRGVFPRKLKEVLEDATIPKVGVNVQGDAKKLFKDHGVKIQNLVELSLMMRLAAPEMPPGVARHGRRLVSLKEQARFYLQKNLVKNEARIGDWERLLNPVQLDYAANDAHCSISLYHHYLELSESSEERMDHSLFTANISSVGELAFEATAPAPPRKVTKTKRSSRSDESLSLLAAKDTRDPVIDEVDNMHKQLMKKTVYPDIIEISDSDSDVERDIANVSTKLRNVSLR